MAKRKTTNQAEDRSMRNAADRKAAIATFGGNLNRSGGARVWTAKNGRAVASRRACRKGAWD